MNIYLHVEIAKRELDAKLLLGLVAAERGHDVVVGSIENMRTPLEKGWFPPGIFHTKDLCPTTNKLAFLEMVKHRGFQITSQDEETVLVHDEVPLAFSSGRFGRKSLELADSVLFFGERDRSFLSARYPEFDEKFFVTGSPRVDLWKTTVEEKNRCKEIRPYVGIVSNFGFPFVDETIIRAIESNRRDNELPDSFSVWESCLQNMVNRVEPALEFARMVETVSKEMADVKFVLRPHPNESVAAWGLLLGRRSPNLTVSKDGSTHDLLLGAEAIIHSGCTTAFEAFFSEVPCISFCFSAGDGYRSAGALVNRLGLIATSPEAVCSGIKRVREGVDPDDFVQHAVEGEVDARIRTAGRLGACHRTVDVWEGICERASGVSGSLGRAKALLAVRESKYWVGRLGDRISSTKGTYSDKFPNLSRKSILDRVSYIRRRGGVGYNIECIRLDRQLILLKGASPIDVGSDE